MRSICTESHRGAGSARLLVERTAAGARRRESEPIPTGKEITISGNDGKTGRIEIHKGKQVAGFQISPLGDELTQFLIASSVTEGGEPSPTSLVVDAVLRVCQEVNVKCTVEPN